MFTKEWQERYWVIKNGTIILYKNKEKFLARAEPKQVIRIATNMRVLKIKSKDYGGKGTMHNFMLEEVQSGAPVNAGKFGR